MKLSVALCTYNGQQFIKEQLESILNQTVPVNEIIICDDRSNDKTIQIIKGIQLSFPNIITIYENHINLGSNKNFEKAIMICSGDYIFLSDQDDIWRNDKVEKIMNAFKECQSIEGIFSNADLIDDNGNNFTEKSLWDSTFFIEKDLKKPIDLFCLINSKSNMVTGATLCFKNEIKNLIFPIPATKDFHHDEWIAIILASRNALGYIKNNLISYRVHSRQQVGVSKHIKKNKTFNNLKFSNYVLGHTIPSSYQDFKQLSKIYFRNYLKFKMVANTINNDFHLNFKSIAANNLELFFKYNNSLRKANPVLYFFNNLFDKMRGKRQLN